MWLEWLVKEFIHLYYFSICLLLTTRWPVAHCIKVPPARRLDYVFGGGLRLGWDVHTDVTFWETRTLENRFQRGEISKSRFRVSVGGCEPCPFWDSSLHLAIKLRKWELRNLLNVNPSVLKKHSHCSINRFFCAGMTWFFQTYPPELWQHRTVHQKLNVSALL